MDSPHLGRRGCVAGPLRKDLPSVPVRRTATPGAPLPGESGMSGSGLLRRSPLPVRPACIARPTVEVTGPPALFPSVPSHARLSRFACRHCCDHRARHRSHIGRRSDLGSSGFRTTRGAATWPSPPMVNSGSRSIGASSQHQRRTPLDPAVDCSPLAQDRDEIRPRDGGGFPFGWATTWAGGIVRFEDRARATR